MYESLKNGVLANVVRTFGERGTLTDQDIARAKALFPKLYPIPDTREVALGKLKQVDELLNEIWNRSVGESGDTRIKNNPKDLVLDVGEVYEDAEGRVMRFKGYDDKFKPIWETP